MDKKVYKYELHCHTKEVSQCGKVPAAEAVRLYREKGYDGIVITDHYSPLTFRWNKYLCPQKYIDFYMSGYRAAKAAAGDDFTVLLGMELRFYATIDDFLVYGLDESFLKNAGNMMAYTHKKLYEAVNRSGFIVLEAHPFRALHFRAPAKYLHGCEIHNGKDIGTSANIRAEKWARENNFAIRTSGSDFHSLSQLACGGITTEEPIKTNEDLLRILRSGKFGIIDSKQ